MSEICDVHETPLADCKKFPLAVIAAGCKPAETMKRHGFSSLCTERVFDCNPYAHMHCAGCDKILPAVGGGGDDGRGIDGYEDEKGSAHPCASCNDSLLCNECRAKSQVCPFCEGVASSKNGCPANCNECRTQGLVA